MRKQYSLLMLGIAALAQTSWGQNQTITLPLSPDQGQPDPTILTLDHPLGSPSVLVNIGLTFDGHNDPSDPLPFLKPFETTVDVVQNGVMSGYADVYGSSTVNLSAGGSLGLGMYLYGTSKFIMENGDVQGFVVATANSRVLMTLGVVGSGLGARDNSTILMSGGTVGALGAHETASITMSGGICLTTAGSEDSSQMLLLGGEVKESANALNTSQLSLVGVTIDTGASAKDHSTLTISGATIKQSVLGIDQSTINFVTGTINGTLLAQGSCTINMSGGQVNRGVGATESSTINVVGGVIGNTDASLSAASADDSATLILDGATLNGSIGSFDSGSVKFTSGQVQGSATSHGASTLTLSGGTVMGSASALDASNFIMVGGKIAGDMSAFGDASVSLLGGELGGSLGISTLSPSKYAIVNGIAIHGSVFVDHLGRLQMNSGHVDYSVHALDNADARLLGGGIDSDVTAAGHATITIGAGGSGPTIGGSLIAHDNSVIDMEGGTVFFYEEVYDSAIIILGGGKVLQGIPPTGPATAPHATAFATAAALPGGLTAYDEGKIEIVGTHLTASLVDANYQGEFSEYLLGGMLADGSAISGMYMLIQNGSGASYEFVAAPVPEPGSAGLLVTVVPALLYRRRKVGS